jgi:hypothetical protein
MSSAGVIARSRRSKSSCNSRSPAFPTSLVAFNPSAIRSATRAG